MKHPAETSVSEFPLEHGRIKDGQERARLAVNTALIETYATVWAWLSAELRDAADRFLRIASVLEYLEREPMGQSLADSWHELLNSFPAEMSLSMDVPKSRHELWDGWASGAGVMG